MARRDVPTLMGKRPETGGIGERIQFRGVQREHVPSPRLADSLILHAREATWVGILIDDDGPHDALVPSLRKPPKHGAQEVRYLSGTSVARSMSTPPSCSLSRRARPL